MQESGAEHNGQPSKSNQSGGKLVREKATTNIMDVFLLGTLLFVSGTLTLTHIKRNEDFRDVVMYGGIVVAILVNLGIMTGLFEKICDAIDNNKN